MALASATNPTTVATASTGFVTARFGQDIFGSPSGSTSTATTMSPSDLEMETMDSSRLTTTTMKLYPTHSELSPPAASFPLEHASGDEADNPSAEACLRALHQAQQAALARTSSPLPDHMSLQAVAQLCTTETPVLAAPITSTRAAPPSPLLEEMIPVPCFSTPDTHAALQSPVRSPAQPLLSDDDQIPLFEEEVQNYAARAATFLVSLSSPTSPSPVSPANVRRCRPPAAVTAGLQGHAATWVASRSPAPRMQRSRTPVRSGAPAPSCAVRRTLTPPCGPRPTQCWKASRLACTTSSQAPTVRPPPSRRPAETVGSPQPHPSNAG